MPGEAFGPSGFLRFSYALADEDLKTGITRVQELLARVK
ncbi:aspartate aminotransferase [Mobiluncus mulieris]|uniref:Aspartate aminotransferase n=1 Tax=Mobiluncus mulieris TaxID=2052 RepID=A0A8G2HXJ0_9ACTO|nr:aspartate aminotransferase [Mobiluncus mulieris]